MSSKLYVLPNNYLELLKQSKIKINWKIIHIRKLFCSWLTLIKIIFWDCAAWSYHCLQKHWAYIVTRTTDTYRQSVHYKGIHSYHDNWYCRGQLHCQYIHSIPTEDNSIVFTCIHSYHDSWYLPKTTPMVSRMDRGCFHYRIFGTLVSDQLPVYTCPLQQAPTVPWDQFWHRRPSVPGHQYHRRRNRDPNPLASTHWKSPSSYWA